MATHEIWMSFPDKALKNVDTTIAIWSAGEKLGEMHISRGSLDWRSKRKRKPKFITWEKVAELLDEA